jgi:hypothetical protein
MGSAGVTICAVGRTRPLDVSARGLTPATASSAMALSVVREIALGIVSRESVKISAS